MSLDAQALLIEMVEAARNVLGKKWPEISELTTSELAGVAEGITVIEGLLLEGRMTQEQAQLVLDMKRSSAETILLSAKGMSERAIEDAINAAMDVVRATVNTAVDFALL